MSYEVLLAENANQKDTRILTYIYSLERRYIPKEN